MFNIPKVFYSEWLWLAIIAVVITIHYFFGKPPPPPRKIAFFEKHKQTIMQTMDVFIIILILAGWLLFTYQSISSNVELGTFVSTKELIVDSVAFFSVVAIFLSGMSGALIGFLSVFQSNLTKRKRLILLAVSVLPIGFTVLASWLNKSQTIWPTVHMGLVYITYCWLINGPAIIAGQHITRVGWFLMRKLKLVSGDFPE